MSAFYLHAYNAVYAFVIIMWLSFWPQYRTLQDNKKVIMVAYTVTYSDLT